MAAMHNIAVISLPRPDNVWLLAGLLLGITVVLTLVLAGVKGLIRGQIVRWVSSTPTAVDDLIGAILDRTGFFTVLFTVCAVCIASGYIRVEYAGAIRSLAMVALFLQMAQWAMATVTFATRHFTSRGASHAVAATAVGAFAFITRLVIVLVLLLAVLMNAGVNVTALLTGLGIGGIAVALAVQNVLRDLLGTIHIVVARPFLIGDLIEVGEFLGTVTNVGLRSTRLINLPGEELTLANNCILESALRNHSRMTERRVSDVVVLSYDTGRECSERVAGLIRQSVEATQLARFERAHLKRFAQWGLEYEFVYMVRSGDYDVFTNVQHEINLRLMDGLERQGIRFARGPLLPDASPE
jgi:small-conductance mechanosensitive channel